MYEVHNPSDKEDIYNQFIIIHRLVSCEDTRDGSKEEIEFIIVDTAEENAEYPIFSASRRRHRHSNRVVISDIKLIDRLGLMSGPESAEVIYETLVEYITLSALASYIGIVVIYTDDAIAMEVLAKQGFRLERIQHISNDIIKVGSVRAERCL